MAAPKDDDPVEVDVEVPGPGVDDFELVAEVGQEPPEAVERTDMQTYLANGGG